MTHNDKIMALEGLTQVVERLTENDRNTPYNMYGDDPKAVNEVPEHHYLIGLLSFTMCSLANDLAQEALKEQSEIKTIQNVKKAMNI